MEQEKIDEIDGILRRKSEAFAARVHAFSLEHGLAEDEARSTLLAINGLKQTKNEVERLRGKESLPDFDSLGEMLEAMGVGEAFLIGSQRSLIAAVDAADRAQFQAAFVAATKVIRNLTIAIDFYGKEQRSDNASKAADARHAMDRRRKDDARVMFEGRSWRFKADAARAIEQEFHVTYKTAERWVIEWTREDSRSAGQNGDSS